MDEETFISKRITNKDVYEELMSQKKVQNEILEHAKFTNGKIADAIAKIDSVKKRSVGWWIAEHPFKFAIFILVLFSFVISDIRHPLTDLLTNFI